MLFFVNMGKHLILYNHLIPILIYLRFILINMVLHHVPVPQQAINEAARVLRKNGKIFLIDMAEHDDENFRDTQGDLWLGFSQEDLINWLNVAGLQVEMQTSKPYMQHGILIIKAIKPE